MSQKERILDYLMQGHTLTRLEALDRFQCMSLSQRVGELIRLGNPIKREFIRTPTGKTIKEYSYQHGTDLFPDRTNANHSEY